MVSLRLLSRNSRRVKPEELDWRVLLAAHLLNKSYILRLNLLRLLELLGSVVASNALSLPQEGVAIWGAAYIHRVRSENLFQPAKTPEDRPKPDLTIPPILDIPIKPGMLATTILEIVSALKTVLDSTNSMQTATKTLQLDINLDRYLVKIEEELEEFVAFLNSLLAGVDAISLAELFRGVERLEAARRFILLLIAAGRGAFHLLVEEETGRILVKRGLPTVKGE